MYKKFKDYINEMFDVPDIFAILLIMSCAIILIAVIITACVHTIFSNLTTYSLLYCILPISCIFVGFILGCCIVADDDEFYDNETLYYNKDKIVFTIVCITICPLILLIYIIFYIKCFAVFIIKKFQQVYRVIKFLVTRRKNG